MKIQKRQIVSATILDADDLLVDAIDKAARLGQILQTDGRIVAMAPKLLTGFTKVFARTSRPVVLQ